MRRRWILWILVIGFVWLVVSRFNEVEKLAATAARGQGEWMAAAIFAQLIYYIVFTMLYQSALATAGISRRIRDLVPVVLGSLFVNVVVPSAGTGGTALFVDDARQRGERPSRAAAGALLALTADFIAFTLVLIVGVGYLIAQHDLRTYELVAIGGLVAIVTCLSAVLAVGLRRPEIVHRVLAWLQNAANRLAHLFRRRSWLADDWAERHAQDFAEAATAIAAHPVNLARTLGIALAAHALDVASLYIIFLAFHYPIQFGPLVAGYSMGILFWIVSPTPQGIGVVEGVMSLVYTSLHVPAATATLVALTFRGLTFWLPLLLGIFLLRRVESFRAERHALSEIWSVRLAALLTALVAIVDVVSAIQPALASRIDVLRYFLPSGSRHGARLAAALAGFALLALAAGLWRRKRTAWILVMVLLAISAASHLAKGLDYEEATLAGGVAIWLWFLRPRFHALSDRPTMTQGLGIVVGALLFTLAYGTAGFYLLDRHFSVHFGLVPALEQTVVMFTQYYDPGLEPLTGFGRYFAVSIYVVGAATLGFGLFALLRPVLVRRPPTEEERARARATVESFGRTSLARITLLPDKWYYFSPGGSVVAYTVKGRVAVALGDPIGPGDDAAAAITGYRDFCARRDWQPGFYQTLPDYLEHYRAAGFAALCIGQEANVDMGAFAVEARGLRSTIKRLEKVGYRTQVHQPPLPAALVDELRLVSDEWLTMVKGTEKRFSLGWFDDDYIRDGPVMVVYTPEGRVAAFANIIPEYQIGETTIDLMRRRSDAEKGTMDFLFVRLFEWAKEEGYATFNLGLSPLAGVGGEAGDPAIERGIHFIYEHVNQFYNFKGLHEFKAKYHPQWAPRYIVYAGTTALPAVALAVIRADSGGSFIWGGRGGSR
jgi:phosphatidylglycerol lysyltransferase